MANVREICIDWIGPQGGGMTNVLFFDTTPTIAAQRTALQAFYQSWCGSVSDQYAYTIRTTGRELDGQTGALTGAWAESSAKTDSGNVAVEPVADAVQVLFQWHTPTIVGGRFLRGRTFLPGLTVGTVIDGNVNPSAVPTFEGYGDTLIAADVGFHVWHRPVGGAGGTSVAVSACTVWPELAVLRRRRR